MSCHWNTERQKIIHWIFFFFKWKIIEGKLQLIRQDGGRSNEIGRFELNVAVGENERLLRVDWRAPNGGWS